MDVTGVTAPWMGGTDGGKAGIEAMSGEDIPRWFLGLRRPGEIESEGLEDCEDLSGLRILLLLKPCLSSAFAGIDNGVGACRYFARTGSSRTNGCLAVCVPYSFFRLSPCIFCNELTRLGAGPGLVTLGEERVDSSGND